jgi:hypothetical protein
VGPSDSKSFQPLVEQLGEISKDGDETVLREPVSLNEILPGRTSSFYRYSGSLTTPNCQQIVIWTIFDNPIEISEQQVYFKSRRNYTFHLAKNWSYENLFDIFLSFFIKVYRDCWNQSRVLWSPWLIDLVRVFFFFFFKFSEFKITFRDLSPSESNTTTLLLHVIAVGQIQISARRRRYKYGQQLPSDLARERPHRLLQIVHWMWNFQILAHHVLTFLRSLQVEQMLDGLRLQVDRSVLISPTWTNNKANQLFLLSDS